MKWVPISSIWAQKIQTWYNNHKSTLPEDLPTFQPGTAWNYRLVVQHIHKEEIAEKMEGTGLKSSDNTWIQGFQQAVNDVIQDLGGEETAKGLYAE
jgi:hypothetical protein